MTADTPDPAAVLDGCPEENCQLLHQYLLEDGLTAEDLDYEDVFYPLRCHHREGMALELSGPAGDRRYVWGSGDLIYPVDVDDQTFETSVDPFALWASITQDPFEAFRPVVVDAARQEADDA